MIYDLKKGYDCGYHVMANAFALYQGKDVIKESESPATIRKMIVSKMRTLQG